MRRIEELSEFEQRTLNELVRELFVRNSSFYFSKLEKIADFLNVSINGGIWNTVKQSDYISWRDMDPEFKRQLQQTCLELLGIVPDSMLGGPFRPSAQIHALPSARHGASVPEVGAGEASEEIARLTTALAKEKTRVQDLLERNDALATRERDVQGQLKQVAAERNALRKQVDALKTDLEASQKETRGARSMVQHQMDRVKPLEVQIAALQEENEALKAAVGEAGKAEPRGKSFLLGKLGLGKA